MAPLPDKRRSKWFYYNETQQDLGYTGKHLKSIQWCESLAPSHITQDSVFDNIDLVSGCTATPDGCIILSNGVD